MTTKNEGTRVPEPYRNWYAVASYGSAVLPTEHRGWTIKLKQLGCTSAPNPGDPERTEDNWGSGFSYASYSLLRNGECVPLDLRFGMIGDGGPYVLRAAVRNPAPKRRHTIIKYVVLGEVDPATLPDAMIDLVEAALLS